MCFRPTEITKPQVCPRCGKRIGVLDGIRQKVCPFCKASLEKEEPNDLKEGGE